MNHKPISFIVATAALLVASAAMFAQPKPSAPAPRAPTIGNAHLWAEVGSFKLEGNGTVDVKFTGTLLITRADGQPMPRVSMTGNVRKEFDSAEMGRTAWFGSGTAKITGAWRHLTVFGKSMDAKWRGNGIAIVYGEFDQKGQAGFISVDGAPPFEWMDSGMTFYVPASSDPRPQQSSPPPPSPRAPTLRGASPQPKITR